VTYTVIWVGGGLEYYFSPNRGRRGFFVSPGAEIRFAHLEESGVASLPWDTRYSVRLSTGHIFPLLEHFSLDVEVLLRYQFPRFLAGRFQVEPSVGARVLF